MTLRERFYAKWTPEPNTGCWLWIASADRVGYGHLRVGRRVMLAHRISWELRHGAIPMELDVLHKCDTPSCVNPDHLFLGTDRDNVADCLAKGRFSRARGEKNGSSVLTEAQVREIRGLRGAVPQAKIGHGFGVSQAAVSDIQLHKTWKHVSP